MHPHPHHGAGTHRHPPAATDHSSNQNVGRDYPTPLHHSSSRSSRFSDHHLSSSAAGGSGEMKDIVTAYVQKALVQSGVDRELLTTSQRAEMTKTSLMTERSAERPPYRGSFVQKQHQHQRSLSISGISHVDSAGLPRADSARGGQGVNDHDHINFPHMLTNFKLLTNLHLEGTRTDTDVSLDVDRQKGGANDRNGDSPVASGITPHPSNHVTYYDINGHAHTILGNNTSHPSRIITNTHTLITHPLITPSHNTSYHNTLS